MTKALEMPLKHFWFLNKMTDRLKAEGDLRTLKLLSAVNSKEAYTETVDSLKKSLGEIAVFKAEPPKLVLTEDQRDPEFDRAGFEELKAALRGF